MMDLRLLRSFLAVANGLSFRKAAQELHYAPSSLTSQIQCLEEQLGVELFTRARRRVALTEQGRRLLPHARRLLELEEETRRLLAEEDNAEIELSLRVSESLGAYCLPGILPRFRTRFPKTRLNIVTRGRRGLEQDLRYGALDFALLLREPFSAPGLLVEALQRTPLVLIAPVGAQLPEDFDRLPLLLTPHVWSARVRIEQDLLESRAGRAGGVECSSVEIVKRCVLAGQGVAVAPRFIAAEELASGRLTSADWPFGELSASILLARDAERAPSAAAKGFFLAAREYFAIAER
jgi:DNA-binding transcriptional LysR family regulator